jgi:hypothetical protein
MPLLVIDFSNWKENVIPSLTILFTLILSFLIKDIYEVIKHKIKK